MYPSAKRIATLLCAAIFLSVCVPHALASTPDDSATSLLKPLEKPSNWTEYFSKERFFTEPAYNPHANYHYYVDDETGFVFKSDEDYPFDYPGSKIWLVEKNVGSPGNLWESENELLMIVDGKQLIKTDKEGRHPTVLYEAEGAISDILWADPSIIFFKQGNTLMRLFRPSKVPEPILTIDGYPHFQPLSNLTILYQVNTKEYLDYVKKSHTPGDTPDDLTTTLSLLYRTDTSEVSRLHTGKTTSGDQRGKLDDFASQISRTDAASECSKIEIAQLPVQGIKNLTLVDSPATVNSIIHILRSGKRSEKWINHADASVPYCMVLHISEKTYTLRLYPEDFFEVMVGQDSLYFSLPAGSYEAVGRLPHDTGFTIYEMIYRLDENDYRKFIE